jgi:hypothetical protein
MTSTGTADIAGFAPFTDKRIVTGIGAVEKRYSEKSEKVPAARPGTMVADCFIGNYETMVLKAKPPATFGAVDSMNPVYDVRGKVNTYNDQRAECYIAHDPPFTEYERLIDKTISSYWQEQTGESPKFEDYYTK